MDWLAVTIGGIIVVVLSGLLLGWLDFLMDGDKKKYGKVRLRFRLILVFIVVVLIVLVVLQVNGIYCKNV